MFERAGTVERRGHRRAGMGILPAGAGMGMSARHHVSYFRWPSTEDNTYALSRALPIGRRRYNGAIRGSCFLCGHLCAMVCQSLLDLFRCLNLYFLRGALLSRLTRWGIARCGMALSL